jgi:hypothetical protein
MVRGATGRAGAPEARASGADTPASGLLSLLGADRLEPVEDDFVEFRLGVMELAERLQIALQSVEPMA